ncbi:MAG: sugar phosphate isomerase/epimerase family protein [Verrucomicrobium sp.]
MKSRRQFLQFAAQGMGALALTPLTSVMAAASAAPGSKYCFFTKHLQGLSFEEIAEHAAKLGFDGIEAPVRPKGHVEPERVEEDLPKLVDALKKHGLEMTILTSGINEVSPAQYTERVLRTAKSLGIARYRMNYWKYDLKQPLWPQLDKIKASVKDLIVLSKEIGIQPLFQNHHGKDYVGAPVWDVALMMRDYPAADWGFAFDILHGSVEGGTSWPIEYQLVRERLGAAYFKDYRWEAGKAAVVPLGTGMAPGKEYARLLKQSGYTGPISLHMEYLKDKLDSKAAVQEAFDATKRDLAVLREWWA